MKRKSSAIIAFGGLATAGIAQPYRYDITEMPDLGLGLSSAQGFNQKGQVVGYSGSANQEQAWVWTPTVDNTKTGTYAVLGNLSGGARSTASSINIHGEVAGYATDSSGNTWLTSWIGGSPTSRIQTWRWNSSAGINDSGKIAYNDLTNRPAVFTPGFGSQVLGPASFGAAYAINNSDGVVGGSDKFATYQGTRWLSGGYSAGTNIGDVDPLMRGSGVFLDINASGECVGYTTKSGKLYGIYWDGVSTGSGSVFEIPVSSTDIHSGISGLNDLGDLVGNHTLSNNQTRAYLYEAGVGLVDDLNDDIDPSLGWNLSSATDINNHGQIIGTGYKNGQMRGFLLTPVPEPATMATFGLGIAALIARRRKKK